MWVLILGALCYFLWVYTRTKTELDPHVRLFGWKRLVMDAEIPLTTVEQHSSPPVPRLPKMPTRIYMYIYMYIYTHHTYHTRTINPNGAFSSTYILCIAVSKEISKIVIHCSIYTMASRFSKLCSNKSPWLTNDKYDCKCLQHRGPGSQRKQSCIRVPRHDLV